MEMKEYTDLQAALPALDVDAGMRRAMGKRDIYLHLLYKFKSRFADFPDVLRKYFATGDMNVAVIQVHSLKGIAASLGAGQLHCAADELEQQLRKGHSLAALSRVEDLLDELLQQLDGLDFSGAEVNTQSVCRAEYDKLQGRQDWCAWLRALQNPLQKLQVNKVKEQLQQMQQCSLSEVQRSQLEDLEHLVQKYKYKQAGEYIESLM